MATIYLSSTYSDLKACREAVYHALRQMRHDVIAMEDYVATDRRPLEKCLADVAKCDLYIGLFAWRYGYVPSEGNPECKSITELEYRTATKAGKRCLIFILAEDAPWPPTAMDAVTGENNRGECITRLRNELTQEKFVSFFKTPEHLAGLVGPAVHLWESSQSAIHTSIPSILAHAEHSEKAGREMRLRAMLVDHKGFMSNRLSGFVGRVGELAAIRQRITEMLPTGGYVTITGQAGQGKSCIIAKLVEEYDPERTAHHFIPFNPGPDYQVSLLRDLMARLILKYDLFDLYAASENRAALRDYFPKVLREIVEKGGQEVVFIDGLDQLKEDLDGERDLSFLPTNPPAGVVFVLGTRPNDTLRPLELLKPHYAYPLPNLSRQDFDLLLERRKVKLDRVLADRFYKAMQENALYLDLVARELAQEGTAAPEDIIKRIADNPNNIFSLSLARLKRQGVEWRNVLKPVLGVLLVAREPLSRRHIRQILEVDDEQLGEGLARLGGLVADDGRQRYSLFHLKLQDYLRQDESNPFKEYIFARDEEESWHKKLADWCKAGGAATLWQDVQRRDPTEQGRREYAREHYIAHLYYALEWQSLFAVLDEGVYGRAKVRYDPSTRLYVQDLDLGRQAAAWEGWTLEEGLERLPSLCRYMLLRCSLASRADRYPLAAFRVLVLLKRRQEAARLAELLSDPARKTLALLTIAQQMRNRRDLWPERTQLLLRAHEVANAIGESDQRISVLKDLCRGLAEVEQWERAEMVAREVVEWVEKPEVFGELGIALARAGRWDKAESMIRTELVSLQRAKWLSELGGILAGAQEWQRARALWAEAETLMRAINESDHRAKALSEFGAILARAGELLRAKIVWKETEVAIRRIVESNRKARALIRHGKVLAGVGEREQAKVILAWAETETVLRARRWGFQGKELLFDLCRTLIQVEEWDRAEAAIDMIEGDGEQAEVLNELAVALSQAQQWGRAEAVIGKLKDSDKQAEAMTEFAGALAETREMARAEAIWRRVEGMIHTEERSNRSEEVLLELSTIFVQLQQWERAAVVLRALREKQHRTQELGKLATMLIKLQEWEQARAIIHSIEEDETRTDGLRELGMALIAVQEWERAEAVIRSIEVSGTRARALSELSAALIKIQELDKAETIIYTIEEDGDRTHALQELIFALAKQGKWQRGQELARTIDNVIQRISAFGELSRLLAEMQNWDAAEAIIYVMEENFPKTEAIPVWNKLLVQEKDEAWYALGVALARAHEWDRAEAAITRIAGGERRERAYQEFRAIALEARAWDRAETLILSRRGEVKTRAEAWYALGIALARAHEWDKAEAAIARVADGERREKAYQEFRAIVLEAREWDRAETLIRAIGKDMSRTEAWYAMSTALVRAREWDRAATVIRSIGEDMLRMQALSVLAIALARAHEWDRAQGVIGMIEDVWIRGEPLQELSSALIEAKELKRARAILTEISSVSPWDDRVVEMACRLVIALIQSREWEEAGEVIQTIWNSHRNSQMKHELCLALIEAKLWEQAEAVILTIEETSEQVEALGELGAGLIEAKEWERADIVLTMIRAKINAVEGARRKEILHKLRMILMEAQQWKRTEAIILAIEEVDERVEALSELVAALARANQGEQAQDVIRSLEDRLQCVQVLSALGVALAPFEEWQREEEATWAEIETIVDTLEDWQQKEQTLSKLEVALRAARQWERVKKVIYRIKWGGQRAKALIELGVTLWRMQEWERAKAVLKEAELTINTIEVGDEKAIVLGELARALATAGEHERLLRLVQDSWLHANTRDYAISLLPIANGLILLKPSIGTSFCEAFLWVDSFLKG